MFLWYVRCRLVVARAGEIGLARYKTQYSVFEIGQGEFLSAYWYTLLQLQRHHSCTYFFLWYQAHFKIVYIVNYGLLYIHAGRGRLCNGERCLLKKSEIASSSRTHDKCPLTSHVPDVSVSIVCMVCLKYLIYMYIPCPPKNHCLSN